MGLNNFWRRRSVSFFCAIYSIDEDDHLIEGECIEEMCEFLKLFVFIDVDVELGQSM